MEKNVLEWLEINSENENIVYKDEFKTISFKEVYELSRRIGSALKTVKDNSPIAIISSRNISTIYAYLGIVYSGHAYAPIDGDLPRKRIELIIEMLQPSAIVCDCVNFNLAKELSDNVYLIDDLVRYEIDEQFLVSVRKKMVMTDPLYIIFTSGSTGRPKGVITSHQSLMCYINSYIEVMDIDRTDVLGNQSPLDYIAAIRDIYIPLNTGCSTVIIPKELFMQPDRLFEYMNDKEVTAVGWSVSALSVPVSLGAFKDIELKHLKKICFSGSVMPIEVLRLWQDHLPNAVFVNQYGPTEATASCTYYIVDHKVTQGEQLLIGTPYNNYKVFLLNEDLSETNVGEIGEICISGPILALGYYNDKERTDSSFILNPNVSSYSERMYRTGDFGRINENGLLEFHGRMDRQIKHMGHRVELDEIEYAANTIEGLYECVALYDKNKEVIHLFYSGDVDKRTIAIALRESLPGFMIPRKIRKIDSIPKLANGKMDMNRLKEEL